MYPIEESHTKCTRVTFIQDCSKRVRLPVAKKLVTFLVDVGLVFFKSTTLEHVVRDIDVVYVKRDMIGIGNVEITAFSDICSEMDKSPPGDMAPRCKQRGTR